MEEHAAKGFWEAIVVPALMWLCFLSIVLIPIGFALAYVVKYGVVKADRDAKAQRVEKRLGKLTEATTDKVIEVRDNVKERLAARKNGNGHSDEATAAYIAQDDLAG